METMTRTASTENYILNPMTSLAMGRRERESNGRRIVFQSFEAAEQAAIKHTMSEPWRRHAQLIWHDENGWHRNWYRREPHGNLTVEQD